MANQNKLFAFLVVGLLGTVDTACSASQPAQLSPNQAPPQNTDNRSPNSGDGKTDNPPVKVEDLVKCYGANSCKGKGACAYVNSDGPGKNSCKGMSFIYLEKISCLKKQGWVLRAPTES